MSEGKFQQLAAIIPNVSRETFEDLLMFEQLVIKWQAKINLVANGSLNTIWQRHILDSVQLYQYGQNANVWFDIGSGGGFPGIVIAILMKQKGQGEMRLIESNNKKASFLRTVIAHLALPAQVYHERIEVSALQNITPDVVSARALASLNELFDLTKIWLTNEKSYGLFQKGKFYKDEIAEARLSWSFDIETFQSVIDDQSVVLKVSHLFPLNKEI